MYGINANIIQQPVAVVINAVAHIVLCSGTIPELVHIKEEYQLAQVLIIDDFKYYMDKVRTYYSRQDKPTLIEEILKYRIDIIANAKDCDIIK